MKKIIDLPPLTTVVDISGVIPAHKLDCRAVASGALQSHELYFTANPKVVSLQFFEHGAPSGSGYLHVEAQ